MVEVGGGWCNGVESKDEVSGKKGKVFLRIA